ncbi:MAG: hypothetical protein PHQ75_10905, partial [Thermoguttaceae bacterium]|nr:hypothetical protein [Thermoguttaceae bacterium]
SAQLESPAFPNVVIAKDRYVYSIATQRVQRPATPSDSTDDQTADHVSSDKTNSGQAPVIVATPDQPAAAPLPTTIDVSPLMNAKPSESLNMPILIQDQATEPAAASPADTDKLEASQAPSTADSAKWDALAERVNISVVPHTTQGHPDHIVNHANSNEDVSTLSKAKAFKNRPFAYRLVLTNQTKETIEAGLLELEILLPPEVKAKKVQPESKLFGAAEVQPSRIVFRSVSSLVPGQSNLLDLELLPTVAGESTITLDISLKAQNRLIGVYKLPLVIDD